MGKINVLSRQTAELIAAGEVVERPASVIKELTENAVDAGAKHITVEIVSGGTVMMSVSDDGCGISREDVPVAFLRHATSKIRNEEDLNAIGTLGFRGEALAAISSVSKVEITTRTVEEEIGTRYVIHGGDQQEIDDVGRPVGTTITVRDLFYNTPARMKFLKKDVSEGTAVAAILDRLALSHPEISFKFIRDGKVVMSTDGTGQLKSAVYSVLGRQFSSSLIEVEYSFSGISVFGLISLPVSCRPNRNMQFFFLNGRFVKSGTAVAAIEQAYKNSAMVGKFPACVLNITVPTESVDVNVHPAKTEVRFSDEKRVFDAVYYSVKTALTKRDRRPEVVIKPQTRMTADEFKQSNLSEILETAQKNEKRSIYDYSKQASPKSDFFISKRKEKSDKDTENIKLKNDSAFIYAGREVKPNIDIEKTEGKDYVNQEDALPKSVEVSNKKGQKKKTDFSPEKTVDAVFKGELFKTYILAECDDKMIIIDKHAAHERIIFERLKKTAKVEKQLLLSPLRIELAKEEYSAIIENTEIISSAGFEVEDFGNGSVILRSVPAELCGDDYGSLLSEVADGIINQKSINIEKLDWLYHTVSCRAAVKAGNNSSDEDLKHLMNLVLENDDIRYCPHGRPVAIEMTRKDLEKNFGRIQSSGSLR